MIQGCAKDGANDLSEGPERLSKCDSQTRPPRYLLKKLFLYALSRSLYPTLGYIRKKKIWIVYISVIIKERKWALKGGQSI